MSGFAYHRPKTLAEAWRLRAECPGARYVAGGTDLMGLVRSREAQPEALISLRRIEELHGIETNGAAGGGARIGALTTIAEVLAHRALGESYPALRDAARTFGSVQVRNLATVGGNLCHASPCAGMPPPLLVLEARVRLVGPDGERELPLGEFFVGPGETCLGPDELLAGVVLDPPVAGTRSRCLKKGRVSTDLAIVSVAVLLGWDGEVCTRARVAAGAVAPRPLRLPAVEEILEGRRLGTALLSEARVRVERDVSPITDVRATAGYRRHLAGVLFQRAVESAQNGDRG